MAGFEYGVKRAFSEAIGGFVVAVIVSAFAKNGLIPPNYLILFNLINSVVTVGMFYKMPLWSTVYLIGWLVGMGMLLNSGLLGILDIIAYLLVPIIVLVARFANKH